MAIKVIIPPPLQKFTAGVKEVKVKPGTVDNILSQLDSLFPGFKKLLMQSESELRPYYSIYKNEVDIRSLEHLKTELKKGDTLLILPVLPGG